MKKLLFTLCLCLATTFSFAGSILIEGFEYANHDLVKPMGWVCDDDSWLCGYQEKDHNRIPHSGNWYAFSDADDSWMFMQLYLFNGMQYRITCWAISDGDCQLEFWAGPSPDASAMHTQLLSSSVGDIYEKISQYVESIPSGCNYIGVRAVTNGNATHLTIDDIEVDQVQQYEFIAEPITGDSSMYPGSQGSFRFLVQNVGYDPLDVTVDPSDEYFTDFTCIAHGAQGMTFHTEPNETVEVTITATLRPEIEPGTICWLDVHMTIPCNCNTAMVTFWVTSIEPEQTTENNAVEVSVYPNPARDFVIVEAEDLQAVTLTDINGKTLSSTAAKGHSIRLDVSDLKAGVYFISAKTRSTSSFVKSILKM